MTDRSTSVGTVGEILEAALAKEKEAHQFYTEAQANVSSLDVRGLLEQLADEEYKHIRLIEERLAKLLSG